MASDDEQPQATAGQGASDEAAQDNPSWARVKLARHPKRPHSLDYIQRLFRDFQEIHGDRRFGDDPAVVCGMAFSRTSRSW